MKNNSLFLKTAFCCMACDGNIANDEINLLKDYAKNSSIFTGLDIQNTINHFVDSINSDSTNFLDSFFNELKSADLSIEEEMEIIKISFEMIEADNEIQYSEIKFFKKIRSFLRVSDDVILENYPNKEDYLMPDIEVKEYDFKFTSSFASINFNLL